MHKESMDKPKIMAKQRALLADRYTLDCRTQSGVTMTNGKPQPIGPTVRLKDGMTWDKFGQMRRKIYGKKSAFPAGSCDCHT